MCLNSQMFSAIVAILCPSHSLMETLASWLYAQKNRSFEWILLLLIRYENMLD